jgi:hypothetical protein
MRLIIQAVCPIISGFVFIMTNKQYPTLKEK